MRFTTLLLVLVFALVTVVVYANGVGTTESTTTETTTPTTPTTGEEATTETTTTTVTTPTVPVTGAGPTTPVITTPTMSPDVEMFNTNFVTSSFGIDRASVTGLRQAGWSWGDIYLLANIASQTGQPILTIANWRSQGLSYDQIGARYNLTMANIVTPAVVQTSVAGFVGEYGYQPIYYKTDPWGNPVLTRFDAERYSMMGYDWRDIAVAANISAETGVPVRDVLAWIDRGYTWPQVAREYGLKPSSVMDVSQYPFAREPGVIGFPVTQPTTTTTTTIPTTQPVTPTGAGPMQPGMTTVPPPPIY